MTTSNCWRNRLKRAFREQDGLCFYCDEPCWLPWDAPGDPRRMATREHLRRRADGGRNSFENLAMACFDCNQNRGDRPPEVWIAERGGVPPADSEGCVTFGTHEASTFDFRPPRPRPAPLTRKQRAARARGQRC